ncbi:MAG: TetR/AcrR family transcriptional regulator [Betaproteobacteria bacterium]
MTRSPRRNPVARISTETPAPAAAGTKSGRGGRPSRTQSVELGGRILDAATHLFLSQGYGGTSIEAVARRARISKRTFYHRFDDKPALFSAVVHRIIDRLRPPADVPLIDGADLHGILQRLAGFMLRGALAPQAIALHRLAVAESARFPKLAAIVTEQGPTQEGIRLIAGILDRETRAGRLALTNSTFAAEKFLHMVIGLPQRRAMGLGVPMTPAELETWAGDVVNLFLNGCRGWARTETSPASTKPAGRSRS